MTLWTQPRIDEGLATVKAKYDEAVVKGNQSAAATHRAWMDRLLDMRIAVLSQKQ